MSTTKATEVQVGLENIYDEMRMCFRKSLSSRQNWFGVTVGADGVPYSFEEVNRCYSQDEYFQKGTPHPVTVYWIQGSADGDLDIDAEVDAFEPADHFHGYGGVNELIRRLEAAGFAISED